MKDMIVKENIEDLSLKELFKLILEDAEKQDKEFYIIISANEYELCSSKCLTCENKPNYCYDSVTGKYTCNNIIYDYYPVFNLNEFNLANPSNQDVCFDINSMPENYIFDYTSSSFKKCFKTCSTCSDSQCEDNNENCYDNSNIYGSNDNKYSQIII